MPKQQTPEITAADMSKQLFKRNETFRGDLMKAGRNSQAFNVYIFMQIEFSQDHGPRSALRKSNERAVLYVISLAYLLPERLRL